MHMRTIDLRQQWQWSDTLNETLDSTYGLSEWLNQYELPQEQGPTSFVKYYTNDSNDNNSDLKCQHIASNQPQHQEILSNSFEFTALRDWDRQGAPSSYKSTSKS